MNSQMYVAEKDKDLLEFIGNRHVSPCPGVLVTVRQFKIKGDKGPRAGIKGDRWSMEYPRWYGASAGPIMKKDFS